MYKFKKDQSIHAGQVFYIFLTVKNPKEAMKKTDKDNVWSVKLSSKGVKSDVAVDMNTYTFISLQQERELNAVHKHWWGNLGVLDSLEEFSFGHSRWQPRTSRSSSLSAARSTTIRCTGSMVWWRRA